MQRTLAASIVLGIAAAIVAAGCKNPTLAAFERAAAELPAAEAAAKQLGLPSTGADLMPKTPVNPEDNAAALLREAGMMDRQGFLKEFNRISAVDLAIFDPSREHTIVAQKAIDDLSPFLDRAVLASKKPQLDFGRNWDTDQPWEIRLPEYAHCKGLIRALSSRALWRVYQGKTDAALDDFQACLSLANLIGTEPHMIAGLSKVAYSMITISRMEQAISLRPKDQQFRSELSALVKANRNSELSALEYFKLEVWSSVAAANLIASVEGSRDVRAEVPDEYIVNEPAFGMQPTVPAGIDKDLARRAFLARALQPWINVYSDPSAKSDPIQHIAVMKRIEQTFKSKSDPTFALNAMAFPSFSSMGTAILKQEAKTACFLAICSVLDYRDRTGHFPKTLSDAGSKELDPFSSKPLHYLVDSGVLIVYSVGEDMADNGGNETSNRFRGDVACIFPRQIRSSRMEN